MQPTQPTHRRRPTLSRVATLPTTPALPDVATLPTTPALPDVATLPTTPALPATATLPSTPTLPATAVLPTTPALPSTSCGCRIARTNAPNRPFPPCVMCPSMSAGRPRVRMVSDERGARMAERVVVVGGDAAGMSAASQALRLKGDGLEIVAFERGTHVSYSACGIPYWIAGDVDDDDGPGGAHRRGSPQGRDRPADAHRGRDDRRRCRGG